MCLEDVICLYEERAAIREYDGGMSRFDAERDALGDVARALGEPITIIKSLLKGDSNAQRNR